GLSRPERQPPHTQADTQTAALRTTGLPGSPPPPIVRGNVKRTEPQIARRGVLQGNQRETVLHGHRPLASEIARAATPFGDHGRVPGTVEEIEAFLVILVRRVRRGGRVRGLPGLAQLLHQLALAVAEQTRPIEVNPRGAQLPGDRVSVFRVNKGEPAERLDAG